MPKKTEVVVKQDPSTPVRKDVLAQAILEISRAAKDLSANGLNQKAIVLLISHSSGQSQSTVRDVLTAIEKLARDYTTLVR